MKISAVSYTFNDAPLLHGLLAGIPDWTRQPDEIVVVDDGSEVPFSLTLAERDLPIRLVRHERNLGFTAAKQAGISSTRHELVFSLDCDSRVSSNYLEVCHDVMCNSGGGGPPLGMAAGTSLEDSGTDDITSRYAQMFSDSHTASGLVDFIGGYAFVLRRKAWDEVGGFAGHNRSVCEDHALCAKLRGAGYGLFLCDGIVSRQIRQLSRHSFCKRLWSWLGEPALAAMEVPDDRLADQLAYLYALPMSHRLALIAGAKDPHLVYPELLCFASNCLHVLKYGQREAEAQSLCAAVFAKVKAHVRLSALLRADLIRLGFMETLAGASRPGQADSGAAWQPVLEVFDLLERKGILRTLDQVVVPAVLKEDSLIAADFSAYG